MGIAYYYRHPTSNTSTEAQRQEHTSEPIPSIIASELPGYCGGPAEQGRVATDGMGRAGLAAIALPGGPCNSRWAVDRHPRGG